MTRYLNEGAGEQGRERGAKPINVRWRMRRPPERPSELELEWRVVADVAPGEELLTAYNFGQVGAGSAPLGGARARARARADASFAERARLRTLGAPAAQDTRSVAGETYTQGRWRKEYAG